jgi:aromatic amino acid aminotransferase I
MLIIIPGLISLGGGLPSPEYFPFEHLDIKVPTPPGFSPEATRESGTVLRAGKHDIQDGSSTFGEFREIICIDIAQD